MNTKVINEQEGTLKKNVLFEDCWSTLYRTTSYGSLHCFERKACQYFSPKSSASVCAQNCNF